jgi:hypothetical protein
MTGLFCLSILSERQQTEIENNEENKTDVDIATHDKIEPKSDNNEGSTGTENLPQTLDNQNQDPVEHICSLLSTDFVCSLSSTDFVCSPSSAGLACSLSSAVFACSLSSDDFACSLSSR